ncbi:MAG TPA: TetR/AcrR family transcriptional regulator [Aliidongia sp.]|uniref:TetR/AcrR family transcriptional regulator n=1 Tax=Aliidongia sp. TaxID=1914230 RepID=UPI002DDDA1B3|nr:TetR/AcrR family transcriptional regulator [Aliidongia sp.]HEV2673922.1 TetR/AcrR family transcriptional regulator [Aliidongia sp.]
MTVADDERRAPGRGGRPSREAAAQLGEKILEIATDFFLRDGYGGTSIEAIAQAAGMSKRTFYHRYDGKPALFAAVVARIVEQIRPPPNVPLLAGKTAAEILERLAGLMLQAALSPRALALNRLIIAESERFPELATALGPGRGRAEAVALITSLLETRVEGLPPTGEDAAFAAGQFLQMVISWPQRRALGLGTPMSPAEQAEWVRRTTRLFLKGCEAWGEPD